MNGKVLFLQMNLILRFSREKKNRSVFFSRHLPSEAGALFNFQPHVQGGSGSISVGGGEMDGDGQRSYSMNFL